MLIVPLLVIDPVVDGSVPAIGKVQLLEMVTAFEEEPLLIFMALNVTELQE